MTRYVCEGVDFTFEVKLDDIKSLYIEVLVMKEHGVEESWTRAFIISNGFEISKDPNHRSLAPLCLTKDGGVLLLVNGFQLVVYNPD